MWINGDANEGCVASSQSYPSLHSPDAVVLARAQPSGVVLWTGRCSVRARQRSSCRPCGRQRQPKDVALDIQLISSQRYAAEALIQPRLASPSQALAAQWCLWAAWARPFVVV